MNRRHPRAARRAAVPSARAAEALEARRLLSGAMPDHFHHVNDTVYDDARSLLYMTSTDRVIYRYDPVGKQALPPIDTGEVMFGADLAPGGDSLYVAAGEPLDAEPWSRPVFRRIDLDAAAATGDGVFPSPTVGDPVFEYVTGWDLAIVSDERAIGLLSAEVPAPVLGLDLAGSDWTYRRDFPWGSAPSPQSPPGMRAFRSADRSLVAFTVFGETAVVLYDTASNTFTAVRGFEGAVNAVAPSPDGSFVAVAVVDATGTETRVEVCDRELNTVRTFDNAGGFVAYSPDGATLYAGVPFPRGENNAVERWGIVGHDLRTGVATFPRPINPPLGPRNAFDALPDPWILQRHNDALVSGDGQFLFLLGSGLEVVDTAEFAPLGRPTLEGLPPPERDGDPTPMFYRGKPATVTVRVLDHNGQTNAAYRGTIRLDTHYRYAQPSDFEHRFTEADAGVHTFTITFDDPGPFYYGNGFLRATDVESGRQHLVTVRQDPRGPDTTPPQARLVVGPPERATGAGHTFSVTYDEGRVLDGNTLGGDDLAVVGPDGVAHPVSLVDFTRDNWVYTARYAWAAPGGQWDAADAGTYTLRSTAGGVIDRAHNPSAAADFGLLFVKPAGGADALAISTATQVDLVTELEVTLPSSPRPLTPGTKGTAAATVRNLGTLPAKGRLNLAVDLAADPPAAAAGFPLARKALPRFSLKGGGARTFTFRFTLPGGAGPGFHRFTAAIDTGGTIPEGSLANNGASSARVEVGAWDASVSPGFDDASTTRTLRRGVTHRLPLKLWNQGTAPGRGPVGVQLHLSTDTTLDASDLPIGAFTLVAKLRPDASRPFPLRLRLPPSVLAGDYLLFATIEPAGDWADTVLPADNLATLRVRVT